MVEGGTLLRCYTSQRGIEGSNPSSSAAWHFSKSARSGLGGPRLSAGQLFLSLPRPAAHDEPLPAALGSYALGEATEGFAEVLRGGAAAGLTRVCLMNRLAFGSLWSNDLNDAAEVKSFYGWRRRANRQSLGANLPAVAQQWSRRRPVERPPHDHKRRPLEAEDRSALARCALPLRSLADLLRPLRALATRRYLGALAFKGADQERRGGRGGVVGEHGFHDPPSAPTRSRGTPPEEPRGRKKGVENPPGEALGRSRGGLSTKIHLARDGKGGPLSVLITEGQRHEGAQLGAVLDAIRVPRGEGRPGRPRKRPDHLLADRGYGHDAHGRLLRRRGISHTIPQRRDHRLKKAARAGRPPGFDAALYARRNVVERCVNKLKQWRGIATRFEKRALNYRAAVVIAALMIWLV